MHSFQFSTETFFSTYYLHELKLWWINSNQVNSSGWNAHGWKSAMTQFGEKLILGVHPILMSLYLFGLV